MIVKQLERLLGGNWKAIRNGFCWFYRCNDGREVRRYAAPVLGYDGYSDDEFNVIYSLDGGWTTLPVIGKATRVRV